MSKPIKGSNTKYTTAYYIKNDKDLFSVVFIYDGTGIQPPEKDKKSNRRVEKIKFGR